VNLLAVSSTLHRVCRDVAGSDIDFTRVLGVFEVLLNLDEVSHVGVGGLNGVLHYRLGFECFFVATFNLLFAVLFARQGRNGHLILLAKGVVAGSGEEHFVDGWAFLHGLTGDVWKVDKNFFGVICLSVHASYANQQ